MFGREKNKKRLEEGIKKNLEMYGGLNIKADNIFFVSGSADPWHNLAITKDTPAKSRGILIEGADHLDFLVLGKNETVNERVRAVRESVKNDLSRIIKI